MKKFLITALVAVMCVGFGATAFAATGEIQPAAFNDIAGHQAEGALTLLAALGVYSGDSGLGGAVKPDDPITRAQFCKVVVTAMGRGTTAAGLAGLQPTFSDGASIPNWAWGYVNVAVYMGIINGYPDGSFKPDNSVTYAEATTMLIRAVSGHAAQVGPGVWPYNYLFYGVDNGFTGSVDVGFANLPATRGDVAQMLMASMQIERLNADGDAVEGSAVLYPVTGTFTDYSSTAIDVSTSSGTAHLALADKVWIVGADSYEGLRNLPVLVATDKNDKAYFIEVTGESDAITGVFKSIGDVDNDELDDAIVLADGTKVPFEEDGTVYAMINRATGYDTGDLAEFVRFDQYDLEPGDELVITVDESGNAINVIATHFEDLDYVVDFSASDDYDAADDATWTAIDTYNEYHYTIPATCAVAINGASSEPDDLAVSDALSVALDYNTLDPFIIRANREVVEGKVASTSTSYTSGGTVLRVTIGSKTYVLNPDGGLGLPSKDANVKFGLDFDGKIYVPIGYTMSTPYVVATGYSVDGSGNETLTVDLRGTEVTYNYEGDFDFTAEGALGTYGTLTIDTATNTVENFSAAAVSGDYKVLAVDAAGKTMTVQDTADDAIYFVDSQTAVVYKVNDDGSKTYIGFEGLKVDDHIKVESGQTADTSAFFELIED